MRQLRTSGQPLGETTFTPILDTLEALVVQHAGGKLSGVGAEAFGAVSVVVPAFNHASFLRDALDSVLGQTLTPLEVLVVDDGSSDNTPAVLKEYASRVWCIHQGNRGVAAARNAGAALATGRVLAFLDADDAWLPLKLERQLERLSDPDVGLVHCGVHEVDVSGTVMATRTDGLEGLVFRELLLFRRSVILGGGSAAIIPKAVFQEVGGFDESLSISADWDLYFRVSRCHKVAFVPEPLLNYRVHGGNMHRNVGRMERDMLKAYAKAFASSDPELLRVRRRAYGGLHYMLAGSYFQAGQYPQFVRHAICCLLMTPGRIRGFAEFPKRWLGRARGAA